MANQSVKFVRSSLTVMLVIVLVAHLIGQESSMRETGTGWDAPEKPYNCEMNALYMDILAELLPAGTERNKMLIIVGRLGKSEKTRTMNRRRLHNAYQYQIQTGKISSDKIIVAEGTPTNEASGRLEFFLEGQRVGSLLIEPEKDFCVDCCETRDPRFYPEKARIQRRQTK